MLDKARESTSDDSKITYERADIRSFATSEPVDLIVSNAALQWLPDHRDLLPAIQRSIAPEERWPFKYPVTMRRRATVCSRRWPAADPMQSTSTPPHC